MVQVSKLNGMKVITKDAFTVGTVEGAELNTVEWRITHLHVSLSKEVTNDLGFKKPIIGHVAICLPVTYVEAFGNVITLKQTRQELKGIPECKHG
jgi:sporulation protein YlmC with PRC-barrel domain